VLSDKDHAGMLAALAPVVRVFHLVSPGSPRARPPESYATLAAKLGRTVHVHDDLGAAMACARRAAGEAGVACVAGSLYLVGAARALLARD
jgi:dihydrofolate synthase/folylpolyglutamate synthase